VKQPDRAPREQTRTDRHRSMRHCSKRAADGSSDAGRGHKNYRRLFCCFSRAVSNLCTYFALCLTHRSTRGNHQAPPPCGAQQKSFRIAGESYSIILLAANTWRPTQCNMQRTHGCGESKLGDALACRRHRCLDRQRRRKFSWNACSCSQPSSFVRVQLQSFLLFLLFLGGERASLRCLASRLVLVKRNLGVVLSGSSQQGRASSVFPPRKREEVGVKIRSSLPSPVFIYFDFAAGSKLAWWLLTPREWKQTIVCTWHRSTAPPHGARTGWWQLLARLKVLVKNCTHVRTCTSYFRDSPLC